jgi:hypothetical protein
MTATGCSPAIKELGRCKRHRPARRRIPQGPTSWPTLSPSADTYARATRRPRRSIPTSTPWPVSTCSLRLEECRPRWRLSYREHAEAFVDDQLSRAQAGERGEPIRSLQQYFPWLVDEGEIHESPMGKMHPTTIPETPPPVLLENQIRKLLDATSGQDFDDRRDTAIDLLLGRGCPRAESIHRLHSHGSRPAESRGSVRPLRSGQRQYALRYEERTRRQSPRPSESHRKPAHAAAGLQAFALLA